MVFHENLGTLFNFLNLRYVGIVGVGFVIIFIFILIFRGYSKYRAYWGRGEERAVEYEAGMGSTRRKLRRLLKGSKNLAKSTYAFYQILKQKANQNKGSTSKADMDADKAAISSAQTAEKVEESAEALEAIEGRALGLIAGLRIIEQEIEKYLQKETQENAKEEMELSYVNQTTEEIGQLTNYKNIDEAVLSQLQNFLNNLINYLQAEIEIEKERENDKRGIISKLKLAVHEMKLVLREARTGIGIFRRVQRKVRTDYSSSVKRLRKAIRKKTVDLLKARMSKGTDKAIIDSLKREIRLMWGQYLVVNRLNKQLNLTFEMMDKEVKEIKRIIRRLLSFDKDMISFDNALIATERQIEKKVKQMKSSFSKIRKIEQHKSRNIYMVSLGIANDLKIFLKENADTGFMTSNFDTVLRRIAADSFQMASLTVAYERIIRGLADAEQAIDDGVKVLTRIMEGIIIDSQMKIDEEEVSNTLEQLRKQLDYESVIDRYLSNLGKNIQYRLRVLYTLIDRLIAEDTRIVNSIRISSSNLGQIMAVQVNRKVAIDEKHVGEIRQFERELEKRNIVAYNRYIQGRRAEVFAAA